MINARLYRILRTERWPSVESYSSHLIDALIDGHSEEILVQDVSCRVPVPARPTFVRVFATIAVRETLYGSMYGRQNADIHHILDHSYSGLLRSLELTRTVVTVNDLAPLAQRSPNARRGFGLWIWDRAISLLPKAARLIAVSEYTKQDFVNLLGINPERMRIVANGLNPDFRILNSTEKELSASKLRRSSRPVILHVGSCQTRKNVPVLLQALALVPDVELWQVGGEFRDVERQLIADLGIASRVRQFGSVSMSTLVECYNTADVFVFPSTYEGFGYPPLEAMACGTPVICSDVTSLPEVVGNAAILINPLDVAQLATEIERVLTDSTLREGLRLRGIERSGQFSWQRCARETMSVYRELVEELAA